MKLSVATNWDEKLIDDLKMCPVDELYGSLPTTPVGGGRPASILKEMNFEQLARYIVRVHSNGWKFNYLLNSSCIGIPLQQRDFNSKILQYLGKLKDIGVDCITVANPYLIELIKKNYPRFMIKASVFMKIGSVAQAKYIASLGADVIKITIMRNRDFQTLQAIRKAVSCQLTLLVNQACLFQCPFENYHGNINAHASIDEGKMDGPLSMYCLLKCTLYRLRNPEQMIRSRWIRPEDLSYYEEIGYDYFKISGREMSTEKIILTTKAYSNRKYDGNLLNILNGVTILDGSPRKVGVPEIKPPSIDNSRLDGFLDFFKRKNCFNECTDCDYCKKIAEQIVEVHKSDNEFLVDILDLYGKNMISMQ